MKKYIISLLLIAVISCKTTIHRKEANMDLPPAPPMPPVNIALVLGGGGARGVAHVGVLEVLEKQGIRPDLIVGTSAGSGIGALYADNPNIEQIKTKVFNLKRDDLLDPGFSDTINGLFSVGGIIRGEAYQKFFENTLQHKNIEEFKIPFVSVTTDIVNNRILAIRSGAAAPAILASAALPGIFPPVNIYKNTLVDGGVMEPVPVMVAKAFNPKIIIAVNISESPEVGLSKSTISLTYKSLVISYFELSRMQTALADVAIIPNLQGIGMFDDDNHHQLYEAGKKAAEKALPKIYQKLMLAKVKN